MAASAPGIEGFCEYVRDGCHQQQEQGWSKAGDNLLIIASNHNHGQLLSISLEKTYNIEQLIDALVPLASIS